MDFDFSDYPYLPLIRHAGADNCYLYHNIEKELYLIYDKRIKQLSDSEVIRE